MFYKALLVICLLRRDCHEIQYRLNKDLKILVMTTNARAHQIRLGITWLSKQMLRGRIGGGRVVAGGWVIMNVRINRPPTFVKIFQSRAEDRYKDEQLEVYQRPSSTIPRTIFWAISIFALLQPPAGSGITSVVNFGAKLSKRLHSDINSSKQPCFLIK